MASRFWVGGSGTWDASTTTNWAATSGGSGGQTAPTSSDTVTFDGSSGSGTCTLSGSPACLSLTASATSITTFTGSGTLTCAGNFNLKSGLTISGWTGLITITAISTVTSGGNTFAFPLTITGTASLTAAINFADNLTISGNLIINGSNSSTNRIIVKSNTYGTSRTITANGTVTVTNADFQDITGAGSGSWSLGSITGNSGDCGGNSGITFTTPATQTSTGTASFTWSTHGWTSRVPLPQDSVVINNAFIAGRTVTVDVPRVGKSIDMTGQTGSPTFSWASTADYFIFGSLTLVSGITWTFTSARALHFRGRANATLTCASVTFNQQTIIETIGATLTLQDTFNGLGTTIQNLQVQAGTFDANNQSVNIRAFGINYSLTRGITMGTGTWTLSGDSTDQSTLWATNASGSITINSTGSTLKFTNSSNNTITFAGGGFTYGNIYWNRGASTATNSITGSNTFVDFKDDGTAAHTISFTHATTQTFTTWHVTGNGAGNEISLNSDTTATHTLSCASGTISCDFLNIQHSVASGGASFFAGANSINNQAVATAGSGWIFTVPPSTANSNFLALF